MCQGIKYTYIKNCIIATFKGTSTVFYFIKGMKYIEICDCRVLSDSLQTGDGRLELGGLRVFATWSFVGGLGPASAISNLFMLFYQRITFPAFERS